MERTVLLKYLKI